MGWIDGNYSLYPEDHKRSENVKVEPPKPLKVYCKHCKRKTPRLWGMCTRCTV